MLAEGLGILQGLQQLQTYQVGQQATGYGAKSKWSIARPGTSVFVDVNTGSTIAQAVKNAVQLQQLGSASTPFASLEEALAALAAPSSLAAFETPRTIVVGPGTYTIGAQVIRRSLTFVLDAATVISDTVMVESSNAISNGSTANVLVQFLSTGHGAGARPECLPGGIQVDRDGVATRLVGVVLQGIQGVVVNVGLAVTGGLGLSDAGGELHAPGTPFGLEARDSDVEGTTLEAAAVLAFNSTFQQAGVLAVTCIGTNRCELYSSRFFASGTWTGGALFIDSATRFSFLVVNTWIKANPGGVVATVMI